jgi:DNA-binding winged helix-turn-helix (wHTH) protein
MTFESSLQFEGFTLDLDRLCVHGPSGRIDLRRKSFDVLRYLVEHAGRVVCKEELMKAVWPDVHVSDESVTQCISEVRRALGDEGQRIIKTVARRGYLSDIPVFATPVPVPGSGLQPVDAGGPPQDAPPDRSPLVSRGPQQRRHAAEQVGLQTATPRDRGGIGCRSGHFRLPDLDKPPRPVFNNSHHDGRPDSRCPAFCGDRTGR